MLSALLTRAARRLSSIDLPDVSAASFDYKRTDPFGSSKISATGLTDHGDKVTAELVTISTTYPAFSVEITVHNYSRTKRPAAQPDPK